MSSDLNLQQEGVEQIEDNLVDSTSISVRLKELIHWLTLREELLTGWSLPCIKEGQFKLFTLLEPNNSINTINLRLNQTSKKKTFYSGP